MQAQILSALSHPVIAAVHRRDQLAGAGSDCAAVFILGGDILDIADWVSLVKGAGKAGLRAPGPARGASAGTRRACASWRVAAPDGVISTKAALLRMAQTRADHHPPAIPAGLGQLLHRGEDGGLLKADLVEVMPRWCQAASRAWAS